MREDLLTYIKVEPRRLITSLRLGMLITNLEALEPRFARTYTEDYGWQSFPIVWLTEYSVSESPEVLAWLVEDLESKGYKCEYVKHLLE